MVSISSDDTPMLQLTEQAFAKPGKVNEMLKELKQNIDTRLPPILEKLCVYITNTGSQELLYNPIQTNIREAFEKLHSFINQEYPDDVKKDVNLISVDDILKFMHKNIKEYNQQYNRL